MRWCADDSAAERRASVAGDGAHGHAQRLSGFVVARAGDPQARSAEWASVRLSGTQRRSVESDLARRTGCLSVHEAAGARALLVAEHGGGGGEEPSPPGRGPPSRAMLSA